VAATTSVSVRVGFGETVGIALSEFDPEKLAESENTRLGSVFESENPGEAENGDDGEKVGVSWKESEGS
jgi:hypothetical protein